VGAGGAAPGTVRAAAAGEDAAGALDLAAVDGMGSVTIGPDGAEDVAPVVGAVVAPVVGAVREAPGPPQATTTATRSTRTSRRRGMTFSVTEAPASSGAPVASRAIPMTDRRSASPPSRQYDAETALVVVDVQNDFADPAGNLYVRGGEEIPAIVNGEIEAALAGGSPVFYTQDWHPAHTPHFQADGGVWPVHCVAGTWGAELYPGLRVVGPVVKKGTGGEDGYSGFTVQDPRTGARQATGLEDLLRGWASPGIVRIVVVGLATDYCVRDTALDGLTLGFRVEVPAEAVRAVDLEPGDGDRALDKMAQAGVHISG
jgi:nicotinamidase/pyrazinamidase